MIPPFRGGSGLIYHGRPVLVTDPDPAEPLTPFEYAIPARMETPETPFLPPLQEDPADG